MKTIGSSRCGRPSTTAVVEAPLRMYSPSARRISRPFSRTPDSGTDPPRTFFDQTHGHECFAGAPEATNYDRDERSLQQVDIHCADGQACHPFGVGKEHVAARLRDTG